MESKMERVSSSLQSWVEDHKLSTIGQSLTPSLLSQSPFMYIFLLRWIPFPSLGSRIRSSSSQPPIAADNLLKLKIHRLAGGVWATAVGASVAYSRRRAPQRATSMRLIHARMHAQALTLAVVGGAALMHYYNRSNSNKRKEDLDYDFYSQLPAATDADGNENERWSW